MNTHRAGRTGAFLLCLLIVAVMLSPFFLVVLNSFKRKIDIVENPLSFSGFTGIDNYQKAFATMNFVRAIKNSIIVTSLSLLLIIVFSSMLAYFLQRWDWKMNRFIFLMLVASMIIPFQTLMIPLVNIYGNLGILNTTGSLIYFYLGFGLSMATFMYHGFIKGISKELEESAIIDGCTRLGVFWKIVFPNLKPITSTVLILDLLWIWNDFLLPSLVLIKDHQRTLPLSTFYFYGTYTAEFGYSMAGLVMSILPILVIYLVLQKQIIKGVMDGAIK